MFVKFFFKNINISLKKFNFFFFNILKFSKYIFDILIYLNFIFNKSSFILKKIFLYIVNNIKKKYTFLDYLNLKLFNFSLTKGEYYKRLNYRSKGNSDIFLKDFCNLFLIIYG